MQIHELGHIVLYVTNIERLSYFYREILGFQQIHKEGSIALFSSGRTHHEMLLIEIGGSPKPERRKPEPGLYHIGFKVADSHDELKAVYAEIKEKQVPILGLTDHGVTHSIYVSDPDGNELELYADVSDDWKTNPLAVLAPARPLSLD